MLIDTDVIVWYMRGDANAYDVIDNRAANLDWK